MVLMNSELQLSVFVWKLYYLHQKLERQKLEEDRVAVAYPVNHQLIHFQSA